MAKTDLAAFRRQLLDSEAEMDALFQDLAVEIGNMVLRAQNPDGTVPISALPGLQRQAEAAVRRRFLNREGRAFGENNEPLAPFPQIVADGQKAMIRLALERTAAILDKSLPEDLRAALTGREVVT